MAWLGEPIATVLSLEVRMTVKLSTLSTLLFSRIGNGIMALVSPGEMLIVIEEFLKSDSVTISMS